LAYHGAHSGTYNPSTLKRQFGDVQLHHNVARSISTRVAKISRRDPSEVIDAAFARWEDAILKLLPPEKRTAYFEAALGHVADGSMTTLDRVQRPPKSGDPYVEFTDHDSYDTATF
jgi:hypothetical protein